MVLFSKADIFDAASWCSSTRACRFGPFGQQGALLGQPSVHSVLMTDAGNRAGRNCTILHRACAAWDESRKSRGRHSGNMANLRFAMHDYGPEDLLLGLTPCVERQHVVASLCRNPAWLSDMFFEPRGTCWLTLQSVKHDSSEFDFCSAALLPKPTPVQFLPSACSQKARGLWLDSDHFVRLHPAPDHPWPSPE